LHFDQPMRIPRTYIKQTLVGNSMVTLDAVASNHLTRVLRLKPGAALRVFNGEGGEYDAILQSSSKKQAIIELGAFHAVDRESTLQVTLAQGIARGERMDLIIQKAVELGVSHIVPLQTSRTVVRLDEDRADKRLQHWQGIIIAACEQSGRNTLPTLSAIQSFEQWVTSGDQDMPVMLDPMAEQTIAGLPQPSGKLELLIGPEGGLSGQERDTAYASGFQGLRLGPRILRTETATISGLSLIQSYWGDLNR
jgi:16S rRNA (uracil1498-N3)-methyltransferase